MKGLSLAILAIVLMLFFFIGAHNASKDQCDGKTKIYVFAGKVYACENWSE